LLIAGCSQKYEIFGYKSEEKKFDLGFVGGSLKGSENKKGNTIIKRSPYNLSVWFGSDELLEGIIQITKIKITDLRTKQIVFVEDSTMEKPIVKYTDSYMAFFEIKGIDLEYNEMVLQVEFVLKQENKSSTYSSELHFNKDYKKYRMVVSH